jgi:predicted RNase H-like HicB family nuclease
MRQFVAIIFRDPDGGFAVTFPDLPGCAAFATTLDDAPGVAPRALAEHLEDLAARGQPVPEASTLEVLTSNPDNADGIAMRVPLDDDDTLFHAESNDLWPDAEA